MIYLALDQALVTTGWAIFDDRTLIDYGNFTIPANQKIEKRLDFFTKKITELKDKYAFEHIFFEDIQYQNNAETHKKLAFIQATIMIWCNNNNYEFTILSPSHWRSQLKDAYKISFGRSRADNKKAAQTLIKKIYQVEVKEDEADAICIGIAGIQEKEQNRSAF